MKTIEQLIQDYLASYSVDLKIDLQAHYNENGFILANYSFEDLKKLCAAIRPSISEMDLSCNELGNFPRLTEFFSLLPRGVKDIKLCNNQLFKKTPDELATALQCLPAIHRLRIINNDLGSLPTEGLVKVFKALPKELKALDLALNKLHLQGENLKEVLKALPPDLISLQLDFDEFKNLDGAVLAYVLQNLSTNLKYLFLHNGYSYLDNNDNGDYKNFDKVLAAIPKGVFHLNLANILILITSTELAKAFSYLPSNVKHLSLHSNTLNTRDFEELKIIFASLPITVNSLDLGLNSLGEFSYAQLVEILKSLPKSISSLDLSSNNISHYNEDELEKIFSNLPQNIMQLNLSYNFSSWRHDESKMVAALKVLPASIKILILENCDLEQRGVDCTAEILKSIPQTVQKLRIELYNLKSFLKLEQVGPEAYEYKIDSKLIKILPQIDTLYLEYYHLKLLSKNQCLELMRMFPNIKKIVPTFLDIPINDPFYCNRINRHFGIKEITPPSLYQHALFFGKKNFGAKEKGLLCTSIRKDLDQTIPFDENTSFHPFF